MLFYNDSTIILNKYLFFVGQYFWLLLISGKPDIYLEFFLKNPNSTKKQNSFGF